MPRNCRRSSTRPRYSFLIDGIQSALIALVLGVGFFGITLIRRRAGKSW